MVQPVESNTGVSPVEGVPSDAPASSEANPATTGGGSAIPPSGDPRKRFGWFGGVFTPSILTILGVIMYLRFGWVVGQSGLLGAIVIVLLSHLISLATGFSVMSIATNRTVGAGGAYFMISRSLGAPSGAAIGLPLYFGQALSVSFYCVGFTEALVALVPDLPFTPVASATCILLTLVTLRSADLAIRSQYVIMAAIVLSLISMFAGNSDQAPETVDLWGTGDEQFSVVFAVFFPAVTGIMAGVSMSGELRNSRRALPIGTLAAILTGLVVYLVVPVWLALNAPPEALRDDNQIVWSLSLFPSLVYAGVFGATLSSAIGSILTAPRTLQALAADGLAPRVFARLSGPSQEPRAGIIFTFLLAEAGILLGTLDAIAPILTMFFLATYGVTNLACGLEGWAKSPSFRPSFRVSPWVSLGGAAACFYAMSVIHMPAMLGSLVICGLIYVGTQRRQLRSTYGDARHGLWAALVRLALQKLQRSQYHPRNWRPNLVILGGNPDKRSHLLELGNALVQERGVVTYFHLLTGRIRDRADKRRELMEVTRPQITDAFPSVFYRVDIVPELYKGVPQVVQSYGVGQFEANTVMVGWPNQFERPTEYVDMLRDLVELERSLLVVRYHPEMHFGKKQRIDIWWGGMQSNGALMLLCGYLMTNHPDWKSARVRLLVVVDSEADRAVAVQNLTGILAEARLPAEPVIRLRDSRTIAERMVEESGKSDVVFMGFRLPAEGESAESFVGRINQLVDGLPTTMMVFSARTFPGEPILFDDEA